MLSLPTSECVSTHPPASCLACPAYCTALILGEQPEDVEALREVLAPCCLRPVYFDPATALRERLNERRGELALWSMTALDAQALTQLQRLHEFCPHLPIIVLTAEAVSDKAIEFIEAGAFEVLPRPWAPARLQQTIQLARQDRRRRCQSVVLAPSQGGVAPQGGVVAPNALIGRSESMRAVFRQIGLVAQRPEPVLLLGETGTGKELVARIVHQHSARRARPFLALNCAAIPDHLMENELFGHERGAFTGGNARYQGAFEQASGGTLFLDEIGDLTLALQAKLLRVLQFGEIRRLGASGTVCVDVRLIAATNQELDRALHEGRFREDLYFRLNVIPIRLPPLREHPEDIRELAEQFVARYTMTGSPPPLDALALAKLERHNWPGNVRELENAIRRAIVLARGQVILEQDIVLGPPLAGAVPSAELRPCPCPEDSLDRELRAWLALHPPGNVLDELEAKLLRAALCHTNNNQVQAARLLGISRSTLREWLKKHGRIPSAS